MLAPRFNVGYASQKESRSAIGTAQRPIAHKSSPPTAANPHIHDENIIMTTITFSDYMTIITVEPMKDPPL